MQSATAAFLIAALCPEEDLVACVDWLNETRTCLSLSPASTEVTLSYPEVRSEPGVFRYACHEHWKSSQVIGEPSSHTASGLMS